jgi:hypothetical protein
MLDPSGSRNVYGPVGASIIDHKYFHLIDPRNIPRDIPQRSG